MTTLYRVPSDGLELAVETFGEGPPLIFAHGLTGNRHGTRKQFEPLADRYRIIIYDQRGHCDSTPVTDPAGYNLARMAADTANVLDALGIQRAVVGGESMGAATALLFAARWPERVEALLLTAPFLGDSPNLGAEQIKQNGRMIADQGLEAFLKDVDSRLRELGVPPVAVEALVAAHRSHNPTSLAVGCQAVMDWAMPPLPGLNNLPFPVCLIGWPGDPLHPLDEAQRLAAMIPGAQLEVIPSLFNIFTDPGMVGRIYRRFLEGVPG
jgi:3-oxoadipate enol-lactonase